ncbi:XRE family transcriptional regulator [Leptospira barantonii]|uniref:XRE family transcriptional regulator n=1 Tax=Leptospira barantonii TaxID=2023184 RepID=A0A5F2BHE8_9LEPT|nr:helix-turn-helix transcriptional regulator [Leptospira barantonii]TGM04817.1 XRE family transcriptional regulator [Leptospira barantonii]
MKVPENIDTPGKRLQFIRTKGFEDSRKLSQEEFAASIFTSQANLSKLENDSSEPTEMILFVIQTIYGFNMDWILKGKGPVKVTEFPEAKGLIKRYDEYDNLLRKLEKDSKLKDCIDSLFKLSNESREAVEKMIYLLSRK